MMTAIHTIGEASSRHSKAHHPLSEGSCQSGLDFFENNSPYSPNLIDEVYFDSPPSPICISRPAYRDPPYRGQVKSQKVYPDFIQFQNFYTTLPNQQHNEWVADPLALWENKPEDIHPGEVRKVQLQVTDQATYTFATYTVCNNIPVVSLIGIRWGASLFERRDEGALEVPEVDGYKPLFFYDDGIYDLSPDFKLFYRKWFNKLGWDCLEFA